MNKTLSQALSEFMQGPLANLLNCLAGEEGEIWEREFELFQNRKTCWIDPQSLHRNGDITVKVMEQVATGIEVPATKKCSLGDCFTNAKLFVRARDPNAEKHFETGIPEAQAKLISNYCLAGSKHIKSSGDMARAILGSQTEDEEELSRLLFVSGKTLSLKQAENIIAQGLKKNPTIQLASGWRKDNFFFVHNEQGAVLLAHISGERVASRGQYYAVTFSGFNSYFSKPLGGHLFVPH